MELGNLVFGNSRGQYPVDSEELTDIFHNFLYNAGFDIYGIPVNEHSRFMEMYAKNHECRTDKFIIRPYYWGDDGNMASLPNFVYLPENIEISWYKYSLRDSYSNIILTKEKLEQILNDCLTAIDRFKADI